MPSCFYGPDTYLDGRILYDTDSKLARRPVWLFVHSIGNLGSAFIGGLSALGIGIVYSIDVNITLKLRGYPSTLSILQILVSPRSSFHSESIQSIQSRDSPSISAHLVPLATPTLPSTAHPHQPITMSSITTTKPHSLRPRASNTFKSEPSPASIAHSLSPRAH